jgi:hypothetical protein
MIEEFGCWLEDYGLYGSYRASQGVYCIHGSGAST